MLYSAITHPCSHTLAATQLVWSQGAPHPRACRRPPQGSSSPLVFLPSCRNGAFNVLVATCIGEEGLDIPQARPPNPSPHPHPRCTCLLACRSAGGQPGGLLSRSFAYTCPPCAAIAACPSRPLPATCRPDLATWPYWSAWPADACMQVDLIVCYDATSSPTRAIQRMGRTGRHKEGRVVYILSAGREEEKFKQIEEVRGHGCASLAQHAERARDRKHWAAWQAGTAAQFAGQLHAWACEPRLGQELQMMRRTQSSGMHPPSVAARRTPGRCTASCATPGVLTCTTGRRACCRTPTNRRRWTLRWSTPPRRWARYHSLAESRGWGSMSRLAKPGWQV